MLACGLQSCHDDDDVLDITVRLNQTNLNYSTDNVWEDVYTNNAFQSQYVVWSHTGEIGTWGPYWTGFTPSRVSCTDVQSDWYSNQFQILTGGGMDGVGTPFIVSFWNSSETDETALEDRSCHIYYSDQIGGVHYPFTPQSVYVQNTGYGYYIMRDGNSFSRAFTTGDYFKLIAHGVHADGTETTADFYLADLRESNTGAQYANDWTQFSLSGLGEVTDIYFTMESTDTGMWGMNTPAYFALDCLSIRATLPGK